MTKITARVRVQIDRPDGTVTAVEHTMFGWTGGDNPSIPLAPDAENIVGQVAREVLRRLDRTDGGTT